MHLYAGRTSADETQSAVDHIAFKVDEISSVVARLERHGIAFETAVVPDLGAQQVFFRDPDGIQVELTPARQDS